ncbi:hypothetical protein S245_043975, partial [Arachis hypogaea]
DKWTDMFGLMKRQSLLDEEDTDIFNSNHDCSESLLQQLNSVASSSGKKQGKKPSSFNAAKDTKMMKGLTDTLKYVFDQQETRLDAFAQAMVNTREEKRLVIYLANLDSLMMKSSSKHIISAEQVQTLLQYCCLSTHSSCFAGVPSIDGFHVHYISDARPVNAQSIEIGPVNNSIPVDMIQASSPIARAALPHVVQFQLECCAKNSSFERTYLDNM